VKAARVANPAVNFRVWCESCCIRLAPNEERTIVAGKAYHPNCYSKLRPDTLEQDRDSSRELPGDRTPHVGTR
jgi:hypothetical protein